jgi:hypothetical protein
MALPTTKGDIGELKIALDLIKRGFKVSKPLSSDSRYDLIADDGHKLYRVQCKYTTSDGKLIVVRCRRTDRDYEIRYTPLMIDWIASYDATTDLIHYIDSQHLGPNGRNQFDIRILPATNGQQKSINWSEDFIHPPVAGIVQG